MTEWLARVAEDELAAALTENADEPQSALLARELVARRGATPITRTRHLSEVIRAILQEHKSRRDAEADDDCVRRVFQAIRIAVNDEFGVLERFLRNLPYCLKPGGRVAVLTFHSGEDRRVKHAFRDGVRAGIYASTNDEVVQSEPRSSDASTDV